MNDFAAAMLATTFCWLVTTLGAIPVFFVKGERDSLFLDFLLGFGGGVMVASSFFSLLTPAIEQAAAIGQPLWFPLPLGYLLGVLCVFACDRFVERRQNAPPSRRRAGLLVFAVTLHNIPEGLAVGVAFGAVASGSSFAAAVALAVGIAIQNFPEGAAVALPLRREGVPVRRAFALGSLSGITEPIAGFIGFLAAHFVSGILPLTLSLAAGCMLAVALCEIIPACIGRSKAVGLWGVTTGFLIMMLLDTLL